MTIDLCTANWTRRKALALREQRETALAHEKYRKHWRTKLVNCLRQLANTLEIVEGRPAT